MPGDSNLHWVVHEHADVAVLPLHPEPNFQVNLKGHALLSSWLESKREAPLRTITITVLGFPLRLGVSRYFSPISRETKAASGLIEMNRFDTKAMSIFFITQDPSIGGFSGAPVLDTRLPFTSERSEVEIPPEKDPRVLGLVHGTISDDTGGKLGAIVPSFLILETLEKAKTIKR